jgi:hypothetical protein
MTRSSRAATRRGLHSSLPFLPAFAIIASAALVAVLAGQIANKALGQAAYDAVNHPQTQEPN